jgi:predicted small secreted protein
MRLFALLLSLAALAACNRTAPAPAGNDVQRQTELIERQAHAIEREAASNVSAAEQAAENEGAAIFQDRANLLNQAAGNDSAGNQASSANSAK